VESLSKLLYHFPLGMVRGEMAAQIQQKKSGCLTHARSKVRRSIGMNFVVGSSVSFLRKANPE
jgi:hypothetical protein